MGLAQLFRCLLLAETVAADEPGNGGGLLEAVQVPALEVLDQGQHPGVLLVHLGHETGHLPQSGDAGGPHTALSRHQLIAASHTAHRQRLQDAVGPDAVGQLPQSGLVKAAAGLLGIGGQLGQGDVLDTGGQKITLSAVFHGGSLLFFHCTASQARKAAISVGAMKKTL